MGMRETIILILGLVVVAVVLRGLYLAIQARRGQIRMAIENNIPQDVDLEELEMAELPSGGARVVKRSLEQVNQHNATQNKLDLAGQTDQGMSIPILMDTVEIGSPEDEDVADDSPSDELEAEVMKSFDELQPKTDTTNDEASRESADSYSTQFDALIEDGEEECLEESDEEDELAPAFEFGDSETERSEPTLDVEASFEDELDEFSMTAGERIGTTTSPTEQESSTQPDEQPATQDNGQKLGGVTDISIAKETRKAGIPVEAKAPREVSPAEVLVVNVMSREGEIFQGSQLLQVLTTAGLKHGDMEIFHKHVNDMSEDSIVFSVANILNPGTFDPENMDEFTTRGVSLFLAMPAAIGNLEAFEQMLKTAQQIRGALDGELKDDHRNVMTAQTIEHYRQRINDFELLKLKAGQART